MLKTGFIYVTALAVLVLTLDQAGLRTLRYAYPCLPEYWDLRYRLPLPGLLAL